MSEEAYNLTGSLGAALFRSTSQLLAEAKSRARATDLESEENVHRLRVVLKILRARQQLLRTIIKPYSLRCANRRVKQIADRLAGRRDHDVLLKTHRKLIKHASGKKLTKSLENVSPLLDALREAPAAAIDWTGIRSLLNAETAFWKRQEARWSQEMDDWVFEGMAKTYRRARKRYLAACGDQDRHRFHAWRKWAKYLLYQLQFLAEDGPATFRKRIEALVTLGKWLGNHHDLQLYRQRIHELSATDLSSDQLARCDLRIRQCERALEIKCQKLGARWFDEKPDVFGRRVRMKCGALPSTDSQPARRPERAALAH